MAQETTAPVFISYSRRDEAVMQRIVKYLRKQGINVWVDNEKLVPGTPIWEVEIEKAIRGAEAVVVLLSPDSKASIWVRREIGFAEQYGKHIFPVLVRGLEDDSIPIRLITHQFVDLRLGEKQSLAALKGAVSAFLETIEKQAEVQEKVRALSQAEKETSDKVKEERITESLSAELKIPQLRNILKNRSTLFWSSSIFSLLIVLSLGIWLASGPFKGDKENGASIPTPTITSFPTPTTESSPTFLSTSVPDSPTLVTEENPVPTPVQTTFGERAWGIDVSVYEGDIDWSLVKATGINFVLVRATDGTAFVDSKFQTNWDSLKELEIPRGAYHSFRIDSDANQQMEFFTNKVSLLEGDLPPILVLEDDRGLGNDEILTRLQTALTTLELRTGRSPILYTGYSFLRDHLTDGTGAYPDWLIGYPLWIAQYPSDTIDLESQQPLLPEEWQENWLFWQYAQTGTVDGVESRVDMNLFNGKLPELQAFLNTSDEHAQGISVSYWHSEIDWQVVKEDEIDFVFIKATEGTGYVDPTFEDNWSGAGAVGLARGAYHFFHPNQDPIEQANHFIQTVKAMSESGELPPVLDIETAEGQSSTTIINNTKTWLDQVENELGTRPIIYSGYYFFKDYLAVNGDFPDWLPDYPLFIASYGTTQPPTPLAWDTWTFWNYSETGNIDGINATADLVEFNGSIYDLYQSFGAP